MDKWEFKTLIEPDTPNVTDMNKLGLEDWELVSHERVKIDMIYFSYKEWQTLFKRRIKE